MDIRKCEKSEISELSSFLSNSNYFPYRYLSAKRNNLINYWKSDIEKRVEKGSELYLIFSKNNIKGFTLFEDLPWDSKIFDKKMGCLTHLTFIEDIDFQESKKFVDFAVSVAREKGYEFLLCKSNTDNISAVHSLEKNGFYLVDTLLDFVWDRKTNPLEFSMLSNEKIFIEEAKLSDEDELRHIARKAFSKHFGRYHSDPNIPKEKANSVYEEWVSSCLRGYADHFFVAKVEGKLAGYSIWKKESELEKEFDLGLGHYSIAGVNEEFRGMGLFKLLTIAGMKELEKEVDMIEGPTHINNYPVQRGYAGLGWKIGDARHSFHKWI
ncbi:MAG: GNAT family N-acetyltransferase [Thermoanaerobaculaceae bacterium]|nr:GNAT family N-acetyltransferase [Thermoanaerobaculaceae bacterium]